MASIGEVILSRPITDGESRSQDLIYFVNGTDDENAVFVLVSLVSPETINSLYRTEIQCDPTNYLHWQCTVRYSSRKKREPGFQERSVDIGTTTVKKLQAIKRIASYAPAGKQAPDTKGAINVNGDEVEGVDVDVSSYVISIKMVYAAEDVTQSVLDAWGDLAGKTNDAPFLGFNKGEVKFLGAPGGNRDAETVEFDFKFAVSRHAYDIRIEGIDGQIEKEGWHYLHYLYEDAVDADKRIRQVRAVYVDQVLEEGNFSVFGIE